MRDEFDPKPRLQLIDAWARQAAPGDELDLLTFAMVDPDASVRERASTPFDRELTKSPERARASGRRDLADEGAADADTVERNYPN